ncbi:hypothetical protein PENTCL1PPCAC_14657 [Pristionchus entomophagus]|uniref:G protein-coupled receptor n=1 Tax=Pristionchus entomophagus TaxID=358040 RepID=A0AAV5TC38_9BILA|nr:hypothetical protein PENTCL1PPCAC_14657 [Pristionchus entomophagus]
MHLSASEWLVARAVYGVLGTISAIGCCCNLCLFTVVVRSKSLRSTCHLLIGLCALLDGVHQVGTFYQFPVLFSEAMIDSLICSILQLLPEIGILGGCACVLSIGLERLSAVVFDFEYRMCAHRTLAMHLLFIACFSLYAVYLMASFYRPTQQICAIAAPMHREACHILANVLIALNLATVAVYTSVALVMSRSEHVSAAT